MLKWHTHRYDEGLCNKNLDDTNKNYFNKVSEIGVDYEEGEETKDIENKGVIHRDIAENETENNRYKLKKVIE